MRSGVWDGTRDGLKIADIYDQCLDVILQRFATLHLTSVLRPAGRIGSTSGCQGMNELSAVLGNAGFFYPVYWLSMFVVRAGPVLLHIVFLHHRLQSFQFGLLWVEAACGPPGAFAIHRGPSDSATLQMLLVMAAAAALALLLRKHPAVGGLIVAALGQAALMTSLFRVLFGGRRSPAAIATVSLYAVVLLLGLALLASSIQGGYFKRAAALLAGFCLPLGILLSFYIQLGAPWYALAIVEAATVALTVIAAFWNVPAKATSVASFRRFAAGVAASLLLAGVIQASEAAREHSQQAARAAFVAAIPKPAANAAYPKVFFQKGVNFTAEGPVGYNPQSTVPMLDQLKNFGVNAIALVPYGFSSEREPVVRFPGGMERSEDIEVITGLAHQRGIKVLLKPQLWTNRGFPGNIDFPAPADRARWFAQYRGFLEYYATLAAKMHADIFSVGVELGKMTPYEPEWRALITRVRAIYSGPLVYSATQGPEFEKIRFWDALDYIGLNEYYPLPDDLATVDLVRTVETVQSKFSKPVIFTEAGFSTYSHPHRAPWDEAPRDLAPAEQARCYEAVLTAFYKKPWFQGVYWWKVGTNGFGGPEDGSHTPWGKPAMDVVKRWYLQGGR